MTDSSPERDRIAHRSAAKTPPAGSSAMLSDERLMDLGDVAIQKCPWAAYRLLRDEAPVHYLPDSDMYVVTRYEDICSIVRDSGRFSMQRPGRGFLFKTDSALPPELRGLMAAP